MPRPARAAVLLLGASCALAAALLGAPPARAASTSSNWAGRVASSPGVTFRRVTATWTVPAVTCTAGVETDSANWIGIGGYHSDAAALEQIGTESDCTASGRASYGSWYELVPSAARSPHLRVAAGDVMAATVAVHGHRVYLRLADTTRGTSWSTTQIARAVDTTSAEWIVEAPSICFGGLDGGCRTTQLAAFGTTAFSAARATSALGHTGPVTDPAWASTAIRLVAQDTGGGRGPYGTRGVVAQATPGPLSATGDGFSVTYAEASRTPGTAPPDLGPPGQAPPPA